jgi:ABC-type multidrug transport system fused ATPase/permease subunit
MVLFADYGLGEALVSMLAFFFLIIWVFLLITIVMDLFRDHELSGWWKAVWVFFLIVLPVITALIYLIARGDGMRERSINERQAMQEATDQYIRNVAASPADELHKLNDLREKGVISPEEFERLKVKIVS